MQRHSNFYYYYLISNLLGLYAEFPREKEEEFSLKIALTLSSTIILNAKFVVRFVHIMKENGTQEEEFNGEQIQGV